MNLHRACLSLEITTCEQFRKKESTIQKQKGMDHVYTSVYSTGFISFKCTGNLYGVVYRSCVIANAVQKHCVKLIMQNC